MEEEVVLYTRELDELRAALSFYADETRYWGPNQRLAVDESDVWSAEAGLDVYRLDVTRDGGAIARAALRTLRG